MAWSHIKDSLNFYRIHLLAFVFIPLFGATILLASNGEFPITFVDSLYIIISGATGTGLVTVDLSSLTIWQQVILVILEIIGLRRLGGGNKELRLWITKESGTQPSQKVPGGEQGTYSYWDPEMWEKARKEMTVLYSDLEEKNHPLFAAGQTLQMNAPPQPHTPAQPARVGNAFQGIAMGAM
ncbi:hypothetical protein ONZ51_g1209 [Trametes cubensis]|uniref:NOT2/NOT3/NOT5 C-terminal domain-containing protein n=1 Tax=Trametes cubensis TaxID=1111947 RepID=A0AAD7U2L8_9APHY|nr:hypothetical protein ONZ51_g1209 [Trametes cubensis]